MNKDLDAIWKEVLEIEKQTLTDEKQQSDEMTIAEVANEMDLSYESARRFLGRLIKKGKVTKRLGMTNDRRSRICFYKITHA